MADSMRLLNVPPDNIGTLMARAVQP